MGVRLIFAGTPAVAVPTLRGLVSAGHEVVAVLTREDAPRGRKRVLTPSEVAEAAQELGLPVIKANRLTPEVRDELRATGAELGVVVAYGALFDADALAIPAAGWINLHFSLLPLWRGAAPVQHNLMHGGPTGVTVFQLDEGVDSGPIWASLPLEVAPTATAGEVLTDFAVRGVSAVTDSIERIAAGGQPLPQQGTASRATKLSSVDGELNPAESIEQVYARFRGVTPEPGAFIRIGDERLKIIDARPSSALLAGGDFARIDGEVLWGVSNGSLVLRRVQPAGKSPMGADDWWRGRR